MKTLTALTIALVLPSVLYSQQPPAAAPACERLAGTLKLPNTKVTSAQTIAAGRFTAPGRGGESPAFAALPAFCRVELTLTPSPDSDIKSEVWLPQSGWNGKFQEVGNGAWAGSIQYGALATALQRGYAAASTNAGHTGEDASFALGHPEKLSDFGYRAVHETAAQGKATVAAFYGSPARLAYFNGCSGGGRMAFQEAQRFPADFDAILAGAPGFDRVNQSVQMLMNAKATLDRPDSMIPAGKYAVIHRAALAACDAADGLKDGLISDPLQCHFDPRTIECKGGDAGDCLTSDQAAAAVKIYAGVKNPTTGAAIFPGLEPGSELTWGGPAGGPAPLAVAGDLFKYVVFKNPRWDFRTFDLARDYEAVHRIDSLDLSPTSPDLKAFASRGGKLLVYHGWADQNVAPRSSVNYHAKLVQTLGARQVEDAVRLFFAPGMAHCGGGEGPNTFDALTPLEQWREQGKAPTHIVASHLAANGQVDRTRPLCPYPQVATYQGAGSIDQAVNFVCASAQR
ncbi:MAG: tannase/feruloyl esterase family alpha/beta hydrolase [Acidobacteriota bacterium]